MTSTSHPLVLGIDVGTSGVRILAATAEGEVLAEARAALADLPVPGPAHEQDTNSWWRALRRITQELRKHLETGGHWKRLVGLAVTSTSGSLVLTDAKGEPLRPAMLYDDGRADEVARELNQRVPDSIAHVNASFSLAKALWVRRHEPSVWQRAARILHPADWLTAKFTGNLGISDYSNALKLGYDQDKQAWSAAVELSGVPSSMFPAMVAPGEQVGVVSRCASEATGLPAGLPVLAGASDGLASLIGSGASEPAHANTTLGTTLVWKVLSANQPRLGPGMYCHHLPNHLWVPGAASNTGPGSIHFDGGDLSPAEMDGRAAAHLPTSLQCYPLGTRGERFPFLGPHAIEFWDGQATSPAQQYAAQLQALACIERWGYERLAECGVVVGTEVFSAGSAAESPVLSQVRADLLQRAILRCANPNAAFGAAILAAGSVIFGGDFTAALHAMPQVVQSHTPRANAVQRFEEAYQLFRAACTRHGFA